MQGAPPALSTWAMGGAGWEGDIGRAPGSEEGSLCPVPSPGVNGETEASLNQKWPCLLVLNSPSSPCPVGRGDRHQPPAALRGSHSWGPG